MRKLDDQSGSRLANIDDNELYKELDFVVYHGESHQGQELYMKCLPTEQHRVQ